MQAAAQHLTPVTLELGGKSPVFVDEKVDMEMVARRIAFGKGSTAGQTCIAPDYVLLTKESEEKFIVAYQKAVTAMYVVNPKNSPDYARICNNRQFDRLVNLLEKRDSGDLVIGGDTDRDELYIAPTVISNIGREELLMKEEIFGPILPVVRVADVEDAIEFINSKDDPLALYIFSSNKKVVEKISASTRSGGICVNDTIMHASDATLPFGGVGSSGIGAYHGKASFDTFTHEKSVMIKGLARLPEFAQSARYAPYTDTKFRIVRAITEGVPSFRRSFIRNNLHWISLLAIGAIIAVARLV